MPPGRHKAIGVVARHTEAYSTAPLPKNPRVTPPIVVESLLICTITLAGQRRPCPKTTNDLETVLLEEERPDRTVWAHRELTMRTCHALVSLLWDYKDVFTFDPKDIASIDPSVMEHRLNVDVVHKPLA